MKLIRAEWPLIFSGISVSPPAGAALDEAAAPAAALTADAKKL